MMYKSKLDLLNLALQYTTHIYIKVECLEMSLVNKFDKSHLDLLNIHF